MRRLDGIPTAHATAELNWKGSDLMQTLVVLRSVNLPILSVPSPSNATSLIGEIASMGWSFILDNISFPRGSDMYYLYNQALSSFPDSNQLGEWPLDLCE